jgi:hypothetical protein
VFDVQDNKPGFNKNNDWKDLQYVNAASNIQKHPNDINGNFEKMRDVHILEQDNMSIWDKPKKN